MKRTLFVVLVMFSVLMPVPAANAAGCLAITKWFPGELLSGNEKSTGKLTFVSAAAVKSPDFKNVHFITRMMTNLKFFLSSNCLSVVVYIYIDLFGKFHDRGQQLMSLSSQT